MPILASPPDIVRVDVALTRVEDQAFSISGVVSDIAEDLTGFLKEATLAGTPDTWLEEFVRRASAYNKRHRHNLKQALSDGTSLVSFLYGNSRPGESAFEGSARALRDLELSVAVMSQRCGEAIRLHEQLEQMYAAHHRANLRFSTKRTMTLRRSLNHIRSLSQFIKEEAHDIRESLGWWRQSFLFVCRQEDYDWAVQAIRAQKISQQGFCDLTAALFSSLIGFSDERRRILNRVENLEKSQHAAWNETGRRFVSEAELQCALSAYERFPEQLNILRANQKAVLEELRRIARLSKQSPSSLRGPSGHLVSIVDVTEVVDNFASLRSRAARLTQCVVSFLEDTAEVL